MWIKEGALRLKEGQTTHVYKPLWLQQMRYHLSINSWTTRVIVGQLLQCECTREREIEKRCQEGNYSLWKLRWNRLLVTRKVLVQDLRSEFRSLIIFLIRSWSFNFLFLKWVPHHGSVCLSCLLPSKKKYGKCPASHCLVNFTTLHCAFDTEIR